MFEAMMLRAAVAARKRAKARAEELADTLGAEAGVEAKADSGGVVLRGRALHWRAATEPVLRRASGRLR